ncbi:MAG: ABC transporter permease [Thermoanaerobaculia bacterium]
MLRNLWQDFRFAARLLARSPGFALSAVLALALGIGANSAVFSVFDTLLLRPLPYPHAERIVKIWGTNLTQEVTEGQVSPADYLDWHAQSRVFARLAVYRGKSANLTGSGEPERLMGVFVNRDFFPLLGVEPALGRNFTAEEDGPGGPTVIILSHGLWKRRFGGDPAIIGKTIRLDNSEKTIVGVLPAGVRYPELQQAEWWRPLGLGGADAPRDARFLNTIGSLRAGVDLQRAQTEMDTLAARLEQQYPDSNRGWRVRLAPLQETLVRDIRPVLVATLCIVGLLLFISCANVANLLLARASSRQREIAVRVALGAGRPRVIRQFLIESLLLAIAGTALGLLLANWGIHFLVAAGPADVPRLDEVGLDGRVFAFAGLLTLLTTLLFGLMPALQVSRPQFGEALREEGRNQSQSRRQRRLRSALVVAEIALSLVALVAAGLLVQSLQNLVNVKPGFRPQNLLTLQIVPNNNYPKPGPRAAFIAEVLQRLQALPGVESAAEVNFLPFTDNDSEDQIEIAGRPTPAGAKPPIIHFRAVSPSYFRTMSIPVVRGAAFSDADLAAPRTAVINETAARQFWPGEDPLGRRVRHRSTDGDLTIVGIVGDVRHFGPASEPVPELYVPYPIDPYNTKTLIVRARGNPASLGSAARSAVWSVNRNQSVFDVQTMEDVMAKSVARSRFNAFLIGAFAMIGLLLAAVGVYAIMAYSVNQRQQEIGIRVAMGATVPDVLKMILGESLGLGLMGLAIGVVGSLVATQILTRLLFGVSARDPFTLLGVSFLMILVTLMASLLPAVRATRLDPVSALQ